ncbi:MAG: hypothetical protein GC158_05305 [Cyanobacteria bacterium RI_101]|nr:hypothetical protein [Cyanobacteria bacterium RI_101]
MFSELVRRSRRIDRDEFATTFGGIADDVIEMLDSDQARQITREAREVMESSESLSGGRPRLRKVEFGLFSNAPELEQGRVAAIDGTPALPLQMYSAGQALCVGIGSISHRRPLQDSLHYWSGRAYLDDSISTNDFIARQEQALFGISSTAYLRYFEVRHGLEIAEPHIFFDGTLVYEWLVATQEGVDLYVNLFSSDKECIGVIKNIKASVIFSTFARALRSGELYIVETLYDHLINSNAPNKNQGEKSRGTLPLFLNNYAPRILRGIFKPRNKVFGFEVHEDHLENMLRIMTADCQMNHAGHEIPFLLNRVDEEVRKNFNSRILQDRIALQMVAQSEELFFEEMNERAFR